MIPEIFSSLETYLGHYARRKAQFPGHPRDSPRRTRRLLDLLGRPERAFSIVRVVGTKGKGSTAAMLEAVLRAGGYRTGLYTSPHLHSPRERIQVQGSAISRPAFSAALRCLLPLLEETLGWADLGPATLFEGLTAVAMVHFARYGAELVVAEAGMGGRSDATQSLSPLLTLLTPIALDHQEYLGDTLEEIAAEKAGAIPPRGRVLSAPQPPQVWAVVERRCQEVRAGLELAKGDVPVLGLAGSHQQINARLALAAVAALGELGRPVPEDAVREGLRAVHWPGRLEVVAGRPLTLVDGAHDPAAADALAAALRGGRGGSPFSGRPRIFLFGSSADKDLPGIISALAPLGDGVVVTQARHHRAAAVERLAAFWREHRVPVEVAAEVGMALQRAREWAGPAGLACVCGSFFVLAEAREALGLAVREPWPEPARAICLEAGPML